MLVDDRDEEEVKKKDEIRRVRRATYAFGGMRMGSKVGCDGGVGFDSATAGNDVWRVGNGGGGDDTVGVCGKGDDGLVIDSVLNRLSFSSICACFSRENLRQR